MDDITTPGLLHRRVREQIADRVGGLPSWLVLTEVFIGFGWMRAATEKLIDPDWWTGTGVSEFALAQGDSTLGWYRPFVDSVVMPAPLLIALVVVVLQLVAAVTLTSGRRVGLGVGIGMFLNLNFLAAGAVTPSAFYLLAQGAIALWMAEQTPTGRSIRRLGLVEVTAIFLVGLNMPFVSTLHPAYVIEDPATMFVFGGCLGATACVLAAKTGSANAAVANNPQHVQAPPDRVNKAAGSLVR